MTISFLKRLARIKTRTMKIRRRERMQGEVAGNYSYAAIRRGRA